VHFPLHKQIIFAVGEEDLDEGVEFLVIVIERQTSYIADKDSLNGFLEHSSDNIWFVLSKSFRTVSTKITCADRFPSEGVLTTILKVLFVV